MFLVLAVLLSLSLSLYERSLLWTVTGFFTRFTALHVKYFPVSDLNLLRKLNSAQRLYFNSVKMCFMSNKRDRMFCAALRETDIISTSHPVPGCRENCTRDAFVLRDSSEKTTNIVNKIL